jgi:hypothetical protein
VIIVDHDRLDVSPPPQVQLLEPWHEQHLLSKLPASTQLVIVLDYASAAQALYHRVVSWTN